MLYTLVERDADGNLLDLMQLGNVREAFRYYGAACRFYHRMFLNVNWDVALRMMAGGLPPMCASPRTARTVQLIAGTSESDPFVGSHVYTFVVTHR